MKEGKKSGVVGKDIPSRKCQTFAMCGTGSDSKAGELVSVLYTSCSESGTTTHLRIATKNVATDAYFGEKVVVKKE